MIEGASIVCFAHDWHGAVTSKTHIMRILARRNRIVWVNSIGMRRPTLSRRDLSRAVDKLRRAAGADVEVEPNIFVTNPIALPFPGSPLADRLNGELLSFSLRRVCRRRGLRDPILWTFLPNVGRLLGRLGERMVIYHCVDDYSEFTGVSKQALMRMEEDLVRRAQLVLTSSERLCEERRAWNAQTHFVSHGVDVEHFGKALDDAVAEPDDMRELPRPRIGFFGLIEDWIDTELIAATAAARPDWTFVLIGPVMTDIGRLASMPNVHRLGARPYAALPQYCRGFDVGIIPFRMNELTRRANPLKLREYLAAGLPVVSTPLPEVERYAGLVHLAEQPDGFVRAIEQALAERDATMNARRAGAMQAESWNQRVEEISTLITQRLEAAA